MCSENEKPDFTGSHNGSRFAKFYVSVVEVCWLNVEKVHFFSACYKILSLILL